MFTIASRNGGGRGATSTPSGAGAADRASPDAAGVAVVPIAPESQGATGPRLSRAPARSALPLPLQ